MDIYAADFQPPWSLHYWQNSHAEFISKVKPHLINVMIQLLTNSKMLLLKVACTFIKILELFQLFLVFQIDPLLTNPLHQVFPWCCGKHHQIPHHAHCNHIC